MDVSLLTGHRRVPPFGLEGGEPGECGENWARRADGRLERLEGCDQTTVEPGDAIIIKTPSGGGYGAPDRPAQMRKVNSELVIATAIASTCSGRSSSSCSVVLSCDCAVSTSFLIVGQFERALPIHTPLRSGNQPFSPGNQRQTTRQGAQ
jgi:hypothetical protein